MHARIHVYKPIICVRSNHNIIMTIKKSTRVMVHIILHFIVRLCIPIYNQRCFHDQYYILFRSEVGGSRLMYVYCSINPTPLEILRTTTVLHALFPVFMTRVAFRPTLLVQLVYI